MRDKLSSPALAAGNHRICAAGCDTENPDSGIRTADPYHPGQSGLCMDERYLNRQTLYSGSSGRW